MKQYLSLKADYQDCILFFRLGDFYEMFFEDATLAAPILDIALTCRDKNAQNPIPLCGVPHHSANGYISKLLDAGHKIALCEQVEDASASKGLVKRDVVRVITPSMRREEEGLCSASNNTLVSIYPFKDKKNTSYALAALDIIGNTFYCALFDDISALDNELSRLQSKEILIPHNIKDFSELDACLLAYQSISQNCSLQKIDAWVFSDAQNLLQEHFSLHNLDVCQFQNVQAQSAASYACIYYAHTLRKNDCSHIPHPKNIQSKHRLILDKETQAHLHLFSQSSEQSQNFSLFHWLNHCNSKAGSRMLHTWMHFPPNDKVTIEQRYCAVTALKNSDIRPSINSHLSALCDFQRLSSQVAQKRCKAKSLQMLKNSLNHIPNILSDLDAINTDTASDLLQNIKQSLPDTAPITQLLNKYLLDEPAIDIHKGYVIQSKLSAQLDECRYLCEEGSSILKDYEDKQRSCTGINNLKVRFNKVFGYFIEVSKAQQSKVPDTYERKQTLVNAERYITPELKTYEQKLLSAQDKRLQLENDLYQELLNKLSVFHEDLFQLGHVLAKLDVLCAFTHIANQPNMIQATMLDFDENLVIKGGKHPLLLKQLQDNFVSNDIALDLDSTRMLLITGPNMSGKSTFMRQTALLVYLAHLGSYVPAQSAHIPLCDQIFTRVGASDHLAQGRSTFMVEMTETAKILHHATDKSLILLDEVGRGTSTYDGLALAWAVSEHIHDHIRAKTLFATHYHELTELADQKQHMQNVHVAAKLWQNKIIFLHKIQDGPANRSYGLEVAQMAGILPQVIKNAKQRLSHLESQTQHSHTSAKHDAQMSLDMNHPDKQNNALNKTIEQLDPNDMTPKQALDAIFDLKNQIKQSSLG